MDVHLEREIRLSEESEHKGLDSWSLQEFGKDGKKIGLDQVPWPCSLYFTASELRYIRSIKIEQSVDPEEAEKSKPVEDSEGIRGILHSGTCNDGQWLEDDTSFSMFGTGRKINKFLLCIGKLEDGEHSEQCI
ncbi:MAG: hypothetical protein ACXW00_09610, partial [Methylobacter sp.]